MYLEYYLCNYNFDFYDGVCIMSFLNCFWEIPPEPQSQHVHPLTPKPILALDLNGSY